MRKLLPLILTGLFLVPDPAGILAGPAVEPCQCAPVSCHCSGHDHGAAHGPMCAFANGGRCGVKSSDLAASDVNRHSDMLVAAAPAVPGLAARHLEMTVPAVSDMAGYETPSTPPPRFRA
jgi:hypothetical protein